jgi:chaperone modulatory protein CbpM
VAGERQAFQPDIEYSFTLAEISRCCGVSAEKILILVGEGVLNPCGQTQRDWRFGGSDLARAMQVLRLEQDLGINTAGAALAVELLDEMQQLRSRLQILESLIFPR